MDIYLYREAPTQFETDETESDLHYSGVWDYELLEGGFLQIEFEHGFLLVSMKDFEAFHVTGFAVEGEGSEIVFDEIIDDDDYPIPETDDEKVAELADIFARTARED